MLETCKNKYQQRFSGYAHSGLYTALKHVKIPILEPFSSVWELTLKTRCSYVVRHVTRFTRNQLWNLSKLSSVIKARFSRLSCTCKLWLLVYKDLFLCDNLLVKCKLSQGQWEFQLQTQVNVFLAYQPPTDEPEKKQVLKSVIICLVQFEI